MKLQPPLAFQGDVETRPPLNTRVAIVNPDDPDREWTFYLRLRLDGYDLATSAGAVPESVWETTLVVRQEGTVLRFPVRLEPLLGPLASWRVLYLGAPETQDVRREWRNTGTAFTGFLVPPHADADQRVPTTSYDFSLSAIRFFLPWRLDVGDVVQGRWQLDREWLEGAMVIVRRDPTMVWWHKQQGYQAVGRWDHLSEAAQHQWRTYCWRHQPDDSSRGRHLS